MSHALRRDATVHSVLTTGVRQSLVRWLTDAGERQLPALLALVNEVVLAEAADTRVLTRCRKRLGGLDASVMYKLHSWGGVDAPSHDLVWKNSAPSQVQFFAWLLTRARVQSRAALLRKNILSAAEAGCPSRDGQPHLLRLLFCASLLGRGWFQFPSGRRCPASA
jgi:hypothetical protein